MALQRINLIEIGEIYNENESFLEEIINHPNLSSEEGKRLFISAFLFKKVAQNYYTFISLLEKFLDGYDLNKTIQNLIGILEREKH